MKKILTTLFALATVFCISAAKLSYTGSTPENGGVVSSFDDIVLHFDFSDVIAEYGEDEWGVCVNSLYSEMSPEKNKIVALYKGTVENGELLGYLAKTIKATKDDFKVGNEIHISFPNVEVEPGQLYSIYITYDFFAGRKSDGKSWVTATKFSCFTNPMTLTFIGASETKKVLKADNWSIAENSAIDAISSLSVKFNYDVALVGTPAVNLNEGDYTIASASEVSVDPNDPNAVVIKFPETKLYNGHNYTVVLPKGTVCIAGEPETVNEEASLKVTGTGYRSFGIGRVSPANNSTTIMDNINVPFKFPVVEGSDWTYGFVNIKDAKYPMRIYKGTEENGQLVGTINGEPDNNSLDFAIDFAIEPATQYTCVIDEGTVKPYAIGDPRNSYLKDYISEKVVLTYTTPALADLGKLTINCKDIKDNDVVEHLGAVSFTSPGIEYNGTTYGIFVTNNDARNLPGYVYEVTDGEEKEVCRFKFGRYALDDLVAEINTDLYEGHKYRVVIPAKTFKVNGSNFLGRYVFNEELAVNLIGAKPVPNYTLTYAVEGQATLVTEVAPQAEVKVSFPENDGFKVASIAFNGEQQAVAGTFTTPAIAQNSVLDIAYEYAGKIDYDFTTGVTAPEDCPFTVTSEGEMLVVEGVKAGDTIRIYTAGGLMMADLGAVPAGMSRASFRLATGRVYILLVNTTALKLRH